MDSTHSRYFGLGAILATFSPRNYYYQVHELDKTSVTRLHSSVMGFAQNIPKQEYGTISITQMPFKKP